MYKHIPLLPNSMITMNTLKLFLCVCLMPGFHFTLKFAYMVK